MQGKKKKRKKDGKKVEKREEKREKTIDREIEKERERGKGDERGLVDEKKKRIFSLQSGEPTWTRRVFLFVNETLLRVR